MHVVWRGLPDYDWPTCGMLRLARSARFSAFLRAEALTTSVVTHQPTARRPELGAEPVEA
jgi:hypothetical protein